MEIVKKMRVYWNKMRPPQTQLGAREEDREKGQEPRDLEMNYWNSHGHTAE